MKPLGFLTYFWGNKRKTLSFILTIAFAVLMLGSLQTILDNTMKSSIQYTYKYEHLSVIFNEERIIDSHRVDAIRQNPDVNRVIPVVRLHVPQQNIVITTMTHHYRMDREDALFYFQYLNINYDGEQLPQNDTERMVMNRSLVKNNNFSLGDPTLIRTDQVLLADDFESRYLTGVVPTTVSEDSQAYIIIPNEGKLDQVNAFLTSDNQNAYTINSLANMEKVIEEVMGDIDSLFSIITVVVLISIGLGLGISSYVQAFQRRKEFAILSALGYSHSKILWRMNKEIMWTAFWALISGLSLLLLEMFLLNRLLIHDAGVYPITLTMDIFTRMLIIPLMIALFSMVPVFVLLHRINSIDIIEGVI